MPEPTPDPLDALRTPVVPVDPDPTFAAHLRARLERVLLTPREAPTMSTTTTGGRIAYASLLLPDVARAATFYHDVLGWRIVAGSEERGRGVDGVRPRMGLWGGVEEPTMLLSVQVDDLDAAVRRVREAGGTVEEPESRPYGRLVSCVDDQGLRFSMYEAAPEVNEPPPATPGQGELGYVTIEVPDSARAHAFYGAALGWRFTPGTGGTPDAWGIEGVSPMAGLVGGREARVVPMFAVDDIAASAGRVRDAGGTASDPVPRPWGQLSDCADNQGSHFYLGQLGPA